MKKGLRSTVKYINPTYMVRAVPANAFDTKMCWYCTTNSAKLPNPASTG